MEKYLPFAGAIALPFAGGIVAGYIAKKESTSTWYETLKRPSFCPPKWVFTPVWTTLYTSMGTASYLLWRDGGCKGKALMPMVLYGSNLVLNWLWTPLFFSAHKKGLAFVDILLLWGNVGACTVAFYSINKTASYLMMPYFAWLTFESVLNYCIWRDNKDKND